MNIVSVAKVFLIVVGMIWLPASAYDEHAGSSKFGKVEGASRNHTWARVKGLKPVAKPFFFTHTAASGSFCNRRLILEGVSQSLLAVSVRPLRSLHRMSMTDFTENWEDRFGNDSPNGVLATSIGGVEKNISVVLSKPSYDSSSARVEYEARAVSSSTQLPEEFGPAVLFIDSTAINFYVLKVQVGDSTPVDVEVEDLANKHIFLQPEVSPGTFDIQIVDDTVLEGWLEVTNQLSQPADVQIERGDVPVSSARIPQDGVWSWQP